MSCRYETCYFYWPSLIKLDSSKYTKSIRTLLQVSINAICITKNTATLSGSPGRKRLNARTERGTLFGIPSQPGTLVFASKMEGEGKESLGGDWGVYRVSAHAPCERDLGPALHVLLLWVPWEIVVCNLVRFSWLSLVRSTLRPKQEIEHLVARGRTVKCMRTCSSNCWIVSSVT